MPNVSLRILLLHFPEHAAQTIRYFANEMGWEVDEESIRHGYMRKIKANPYALILLDDSALKRDSLNYCSAIKRAVQNKSLLLFVTEGGIVERLMGFQAGADDCISKPFSIRELLYRMRGLLERSAGYAGQSTPIAFRSRLLSTKLKLERLSPLLWVNRYPVHLSGREHKVMSYLADHTNRTVSREELLQIVWQSEDIGYFRTVDTIIKRIREKLKQISPDLAGMIRTERGRGYCLMDPSAVTG